MNRPLAWITSTVFIMGMVGNATAGNLNALITTNTLVTADAGATYDKGVQLAREGHYKRAQQLFEKTLQKEPNHVGALSYMSAVHANAHQYSSAITAANKALKISPMDEMANQTLVRVYETRGSWKQMVAPLNILTQNYSSNARYHAKLGEAHYRLKHYEDAQGPLQQAVNYNSMDYLSAYRLGEVEARLGNYQNAVGYLEQSLNSAPSRTVKYYNMGLVYGYLKRHDEAIRYFELALNHQPGMAAAYYNIGAMYQNKEDLESAMQNYEKALQYDRNLDMASSNLDYLKGYLERKKKQQEAPAEMILEQKSQKTPTDLFEPPPVEDAPTIDEAPVEDTTSMGSPMDNFESPSMQESFDTMQEQAPMEETPMDSFNTMQEDMPSMENTPVDSFDAVQEEVTPSMDTFSTAEEAPAMGETPMDEAPMVESTMDQATDSFETTVESGVESASDSLESPETTPVATSEENPDVTPLGTSADSFESSTGTESGSESPTAEVPAADESSDVPAGFEDAVDANDYSFRNF